MNSRLAREFISEWNQMNSHPKRERENERGRERGEKREVAKLSVRKERLQWSSREVKNRMRKEFCKLRKWELIGF